MKPVHYEQNDEQKISKTNLEALIIMFMLGLFQQHKGPLMIKIQ